jgi:RNA recognition motif-containing protein
MPASARAGRCAPIRRVIRTWNSGTIERLRPTHEELRRLFEAYGQVVQVHIIVDRDTGLPRGFAFVEMTNDAEAEKAIRALNGSILRDRTLDVNYARPRPERPAA